MNPVSRFLVNDMIGRNGHMRWPEALVILGPIWRSLPSRYKYNHQLHRQEDEFVNWDCSTEGFEGIRAEDILPLLLNRFDFETFVGFSNLSDPFVDRSFGHNFDVDDEMDRDLILKIGQLDDDLIDLGVLKPTKIIASLRIRSTAPARVWKHWTPEFCVRPPGRAGPDDSGSLVNFVKPFSTEVQALIQRAESADAAVAAMRGSRTFRYTQPVRSALARVRRRG
jgi:hypothetical protein